jgi:hypothetical protein
MAGRRVRSAGPDGEGQPRRALRFRIEAALARRLGVMPKPSAWPDPVSFGGTMRCEGWCGS